MAVEHHPEVVRLFAESAARIESCYPADACGLWEVISKRSDLATVINLTEAAAEHTALAYQNGQATAEGLRASLGRWEAAWTTAIAAVTKRGQA